jgi:CheY-like chemotaxis protein
MELAFIIIDDSELDCFIAKKIIGQNNDRIKVTAYLDANIALRQIKEFNNDAADAFTVILLDLYLPVMNGFEFIEEFEKLPYSVRNKYVVYVLSSTMNQSDVNRINRSESIVRLLNKPLTKVNFNSILADMQDIKSLKSN